MRKAIIAGVIVCGAVLALLAPDVAVFGPERFERGNGKPVLITREFSSPITGNDLKLRIVNGDEQGDNRVTAGRVTLNGLEIVSKDDFKKKVGLIERLVSIGESNVLTVMLEGKPGSLMTLGIYGFAPEPVASIEVVPGTIWSWETARLTWTSQFASKVIIDPGLGEVALNGSMAVQPGETTTYTLMASGLGGLVSASCTLTVLQDETLPTIAISEPQAGAAYRSLPVDVSASFSDGESGIDPESIAVTLNGTDITDSLGVVGALSGVESGALCLSESGRWGGAVSAEESGASCFPFTVQQLTGQRFVSLKCRTRLRSNIDIFPPKTGSVRLTGPEQNCLPKFSSNMKRLPIYRRYERGAAAIPGTGMLNRIAESPQFVKPQAKLSTVLAGSEGDWCESLAPDGYDPVVRPSPDGGGSETVAAPRSSAMIVGEIGDEALFNDGENTLTVAVADRAGNRAEQNVTFTFVKIDEKNQTIIYGRVFDVSADQPLAGAVIKSSGKMTESDGDGYFHLVFGQQGLYELSITKPGYTEVNRKIFLELGHEGIVDDAYLTPLDAKITAIGPEGGTASNSDDSVELIVPAGALSAINNIGITRLPSSKALPGDLNAGDNIDYPISFLFCADLQPDGLTFNQPVVLRVKNTWGFEPGTEIPYAFWDKEHQKWQPVNGKMATVDAQGLYLAGEITHFSAVDYNSPLWIPMFFGYGHPLFDPSPDDDTCDVGSSVNIATGSMKNEFSVPGLKTRAGDTGITFVYNSKTAYPTEIIRFSNFQDTNLVRKPIRTRLKVTSPLVVTGGGTSDINPGNKTIHFKPQEKLYAHGSFFLKGIYPSGRTIKTGYQDIDFSFTTYYPGNIGKVSKWGGIPTGSTATLAPEPAYLEHEDDGNYFMVSRADSAFGKGWWIGGLKQLHLDTYRTVVIEADGSYTEYEKGINYAEARYGAKLGQNNVSLNHPQSCLQSPVFQDAAHINPTQFADWGLPTSVDTTFEVDLGQVREISEIGLEFPPYWNAGGIWDRLRICTSLDQENWDVWGASGLPTLKIPLDNNDFDALDFKIKSPYRQTQAPRSVRYIRFQLGYPYLFYGSSLSTIINRVFALGEESLYSHKNGETWPRLYKSGANGLYIQEESNGTQYMFNEAGQMIGQKDPKGREIQYLYQDDKLFRIEYPGGEYMEFIYQSNGLINEIKDSLGRTTRIAVDETGGISEVAYPDSSKRQYGYDRRGLMVLEKIGEAVKTYTWDDIYPVLRLVTLPNGGERVIESSAYKYRLNEIESEEDDLADFPLESDDNLTESRVVYEDGREEQQLSGRGRKEVYVNGKLKEKTIYANRKGNRLPVKVQSGDKEEETSQIYYNGDFQVTKVTGGKVSDLLWLPVDSNVHAYFVKGTENASIAKKDYFIEYNVSRQVSRIRSTGLDTTFTYDAVGNLLSAVDTIRAKTTLYTYNAAHDLIKIQYPDNKINEFVYDAKGLVQQMKNNDGTSVNITRNAAGDIVSISDEANRTVILERDIMGRVIKETAPSGRIVRYEWGASGCESCGSEKKLTKIIDSGNKQWEFKYDTMGNVIEMIYPDLSKIEQRFDVAGRLEWFKNKRGQEITYAYDGDGRLIIKTLPEGEIDFSYDDRNRLIEVSGPGYHYKYDYGVAFVGGNSPLVMEINLENGQWVQHIYDNNGLPQRYYDSFLWEKGYQYNFTSGTGTPIGFTPTKVWYAKKGIGTTYNTEYKHDPMGRLRNKLNTFFGTEEWYTYDSKGLLQQILYRQYPNMSGSFPTVTLDLQRDLSGLITALTGDKQLSASFNPDLEITAVQHTLPTSFSEAYSYDARGNRLTSLSNTFSYNDINQLTESATHTYLYDADGNLTQERNKASGELKKYFYSSENRLIGFEHYANEFTSVDQIAQYTYDLYGRRIQKTVNGNITNFLWDEDNISLELNENNQPIRRYVYGVGMDNVEGHFEHSEATSNPFATDRRGWYTYIKDQVGTVYKTFSHERQVVSNTKTFDTFGTLINQSGSTKSPIGFQSKYMDQESGLFYFYNRYYQPSIGRFLTPDPIGLRGGINLYLFVINDPISFNDPLGTIFNKGKYENGSHHTLVPGTDDPSYNCMAYAIGIKYWKQTARKSDDPNIIPPKFKCRKTNCNNPGCKSCEHLIAVYEDRIDCGNWHVYKKAESGWSCKYGGGKIGIVSDPTKDYMEVYEPNGYKRTCWCCENKE